jgi:hypothetical protein
MGLKRSERYTVDQSQGYSLAKAAGLPDAKAKIAAAIMMAESGGNPTAHNGNAATGDDSYGLWQINMKGDLGPARRTQFGLKANTDLFSPTINARAMSELSKQGQDFTKWTTFTTTDSKKSYKRFMGNNVSLVDVSAGTLAALFPGLFGWLPGASDAAGTVGNTWDDAVGAARVLAGATQKTAAWVSDSKNWLRVALVIGGAVVVTVGVSKLAATTNTGRKVVKTTKTIAGKAVAGAAMVAK